MQATVLRRLAGVALVVSLCGGCADWLYTLDPSTSDGALLTRDQFAITHSRNGVTITAGPIRHFYNADVEFGILIANDTSSPLEVRFENAALLVSGKAQAFMTPARVSELVATQKRGETMRRIGDAALAGGLAASAGSLTPHERQMRETAFKAPEQFLRAIEGAHEKGAAAEAAKISAQSNSLLWEQTHKLRSLIPGNFALKERHYWRSETIAPGERVFRTLLTDAAVLAARGQVEMVDFHLRLALPSGDYAYRFQAVPRPFREGMRESTRRDKASEPK